MNRVFLALAIAVALACTPGTMWVFEFTSAGSIWAKTLPFHLLIAGCGQGVCPDESKLIDLARKVQGGSAAAPRGIRADVSPKPGC